MHDGVRLERHGRLDPRGGRIDDRDPGEHVLAVDPLAQRRPRGGELDPRVDALRLGRVRSLVDDDATPGLDDPAHVLVLLGRQADHEVELHAVPAAREDALGRGHELLFGDVLVHHVAHALRAGLGRERQPADPRQRELVE